jgi:hypothetical protein
MDLGDSWKVSEADLDTPPMAFYFYIALSWKLICQGKRQDADAASINVTRTFQSAVVQSNHEQA